MVLFNIPQNKLISNIMEVDCFKTKNFIYSVEATFLYYQKKSQWPYEKPSVITELYN